MGYVHRDHFAVQAAVTGFDKYLDKPYVNIWDKRKKIAEILAENGLKADETLFIGDMEHEEQAVEAAMDEPPLDLA